MRAKRVHARQAVKTAKPVRNKRRHCATVKAANEQLFRRIFAIVFALMLVTVMVGLAPVWLSAEATRAAQHSQILQDEIRDTLAMSESLEMQRAAITNNLRLNQSAVQDLGMTRFDGNYTYVHLDGIELIADSSLSMTGEFNITGDSVAHLALLSLEQNDENFNRSAAAPTSSSNLGQMFRASLDTIAQLSAGEASTLLIGDIGLAGMR